MKLLIIFSYLIVISFSYASDKPDIKNLVLTKNSKIYEDVIFKDINQKNINLNDFKGKLIILNFWATWCAPCKEEMPHLNQLKSQPKFKDIEILPINVADEEIKKSKKFFEDLNLDNLEIFNGSSILMAKKFKLRGIPTTIIIDKEGYERARIIGFIDFKNKSLLDWLSNYL